MRVKNARSLSLTNGNVWKTLLLYSLPLFGSALVQQFYSLVDLLVVGNFAAEGALAVDAIGNATVIVNILLAFALGANDGCSVTVAKYAGAKYNNKMRETVNTALISFSVLCAVIMIVGFGAGKASLTALSVHDAYFADCAEYLHFILFPIYYCISSTLSKLKINALSYTLFSYIKHPRKIYRSSIYIRFSANNN